MNQKSGNHKAEEFDSKFEEKVLYINRCSKVVKGGRKFSFSALILIGDRQGRLGFGFAKSNEVSDAIRKGTDAAKKNVLSFEREGTTIPHEVVMEWDGARVLLRPAPAGTGVIAGSKVRSVLELGGVMDVVAKSSGSNNPLNQVRATLKALFSLKNRAATLKKRGVGV